MENLKLELAEATLADIKQMVKEFPNDMDLGKHVRNYFLKLPDLIENFKKDIDNL